MGVMTLSRQASLNQQKSETEKHIPINIPLEQAGQLLALRFFVLHIEEESGRSMLILEEKHPNQHFESGIAAADMTRGCVCDFFDIFLAKLQMTFQEQSTDPCATNRTLVERDDFE